VCGILGGIGTNIHSFIELGLPELKKRGPDNQSYLALSNSLIMGASRLAMTDLHPRSNQPMVDPENKNVIVFNGEIYNYVKLKKRLLSSGIRFTTQSDTEVLLKLLSIYGTKIIPELEGMFSFVFFDYKKKILILSRDFLGKKPLFYHLDSNIFLFSSQTNIIKNFLGTSKISMDSVSQFLKFGYLFDPNTIYQDIYSVKPGEVMVFDIENLKIISSEIFVPFIHSQRTDKLVVAQAVDESILERTVGHNSFAISLSGGVDSSIIAMQCAKYKLPVTAYTLSFKGADKDVYNEDSKSARLIARKLRIDFKEIIMPSAENIPELLDQYLYSISQPNSNPTGISQIFLYSQIAKDGHRLALTGDGGDEIFGGYARHSQAKSIEFLSRLSFLNQSRLIENKIGNPKIVNQFLSVALKANSFDFWMFWHLISDSTTVRKISNLNSEIIFDNEVYLKLNEIFGDGSKVSEIMIKDLSIWLSMESNPRLDSVSMWNSIEARSPFQSEKVVKSGYDQMKKNHYKKLGKQILIDNFPDVINLPLVNKKLGFMSPLGYWLRSNPKLIDNSISYLETKICLNISEINKLRSSPERGQWGDFKVLWNLIVLSRWLELNS